MAKTKHAKHPSKFIANSAVATKAPEIAWYIKNPRKSPDKYNWMRRVMNFAMYYKQSELDFSKLRLMSLEEGKRALKPTPQRISELSGHISLRLDYLPVAWEEASEAMANFVAEINNNRKINPDNGSVMTGVNGDIALMYKAILSAKAAIYETETCIDLMAQFIRSSARWTKQKYDGDFPRLIAELTEESGGNGNWYTILKEARNHYMHEATAYLVVDWSPEADVILLKGDIDDFKDTSKFYRYSDLRAAYLSFNEALPALEAYLARMFFANRNIPTDKKLILFDLISDD